MHASQHDDASLIEYSVFLNMLNFGRFCSVLFSYLSYYVMWKLRCPYPSSVRFAECNSRFSNKTASHRQPCADYGDSATSDGSVRVTTSPVPILGAKTARKAQHAESGDAFLERFGMKAEEFLRKIVTGHEISFT